MSRHQDPPSPKPREKPHHHGASLRGAIGKVAAASAFALMLGEVVSLTQTVALARLLSPAEVGLFAAGSVLITFLGNFVEGGLRSGLVTRTSDVDDAAQTVFWATLLSGLGMCLATIAAAPILALVFHSDTAGLVCAGMSGVLVLYSLTNVPEALLQREFSVRRRLIVGPSVATSFAVVSVTLASLGFGVWSLVVGSYASYAAWVIAVWSLCKWRPGQGHASIRLWRELARFGFPLVLGMFGDRVQKMGQALVTGRALGPSGLGFLRYGERMARVPVSALIEVSSISLFPAFARIAGERDRMKTAYLRALGLVTLGAAAVSAMLVAVGEPLAVLVLGEKWRSAGVVLVAMAGLGLGKAFTTVSEEAIKGAGRTRLLNWYTLTETGLSLLLLVVLVRPFGLIGVALSISITAMVVGVVVTALAQPVVGVSVRQILRVSLPPLLAAAVGLAVVAPLEHFVMRSDTRDLWVGLGLLVVDGLVFLGIYIAVLLVISPAEIRYVARLLAGLRRRRQQAVTGPDDVAVSEAETGQRPADPSKRA